MRKLLVAMTVLMSAGYAGAGDYHKAATLRCSQCHTMHASRQHGFNAGTADGDYPLSEQGFPKNKLLIQAGTNETCLACHDNVGAYPDVLGQNTGLAAVNTRSAGALNGTVGSHASGSANDAATTAYAGWMGHTLGSLDTPPGYEAVYVPSEGGFNCGNCHAVHGSVAYRNAGLSQYMGLDTFAHDTTNPFAASGPTYNSARVVDVTTDPDADGFINADGTKDVTITTVARNYATASVKFGVGSANTSEKNGMNAYCAVCHGNFHGTANTVDPVVGVDFVRHPTSGVARADATSLLSGLAGTAQTALVRPAWTAVENGGFEAACLSCHKAHGNARGYALIYPDNDATVVNYEEGDAVAVDLGDGSGTQYPLRNLCITCHPMGRY